MFKSVINSYKNSLRYSKNSRAKKMVYAALLASALYLGGWNLEPLNFGALIFCSLGYAAANWPNSLMNKVGKRFGFVTLVIAILASVFVMKSVGAHYPEIMTEKARKYISSSMWSILLLYVVSRAMIFYYFVVHVVSFNQSGITRGMKVVGLFIMVSSFVFAPFATAFVLYPCVILTILHVLCSSSFDVFLTRMSQNNTTKKPESISPYDYRRRTRSVNPMNTTELDHSFYFRD